MTARVVHLDTDTHNAVQALLPWYANGSLAPAERTRVEAHLTGCARCQAELEWERKLRASQVDDGAQPQAGDADRSWAALQASLQAQQARRRRPLRWLAEAAHATWRHAWGDSAPWLRWLVAAQAMAIVALGGVLLQTPPPTSGSSYLALGAPGQAAGNAVVMFRAGASEQSLREALHDSGARLVGGPTAAGAYVIDIPPADLQAALGRLRAQPSVALAESLDGRGGR